MQYTSILSGPIHGIVTPPPDKSLSHRALLIGAMAVGTSRITNLSRASDVTCLIQALRQLGVSIAQAKGYTEISGVGWGGFRQPDDVLDLGNSGTAMRLLLGALSSMDIQVHMTGDQSLRRRPMNRVIEPLRLAGATITCRDGGYLPLMIRGARWPLPIEWVAQVPSAQVKSAVLLAGLGGVGQTIYHETVPTRDHTEIMLQAFGVQISTEGRIIRVPGSKEFYGQSLTISADPSAAAFIAAAAAMQPRSEVTIKDVCINHQRIGFFDTLGQMGVVCRYIDQRVEAGEKVATITIAAPDNLQAVDVAAQKAPAMIDEYPILAILATKAHGTSRLRGLAELRVKESNRLQAIVSGITQCGGQVKTLGDDIIITGSDIAGGVTVDCEYDHRIAMAFLILGARADRPIMVNGCEHIATSFPDFAATMNGLGLRIA